MNSHLIQFLILYGGKYMYCNDCGYEAGNSNFCPKCGAKMPIGYDAMIPVENFEKKEESFIQNKNKKTKIRQIRIGILLVFVAAVLFAGGFLLNKFLSNRPSDNDGVTQDIEQSTLTEQGLTSEQIVTSEDFTTSEKDNTESVDDITEDDSLVDEGNNDEIYSEIIEKYKKESYNNQDNDYIPKQYYYSLYDINNDGTNELLIWEKYYDEMMGIDYTYGKELYTILNGRVEKVDIPKNGQSFKEINFTENGNILITYISRVPSDGYCDLYLYDLNNGMLTFVESLFVESLDYNGEFHYYNEINATLYEMDSSDWVDCFDAIYSKKIDLEKIQIE